MVEKVLRSVYTYDSLFVLKLWFYNVGVLKTIELMIKELLKQKHCVKNNIK